MITLIAIDPGAKGAIIVRQGMDVTAHKMPDTEKDTCDIIAQAQSASLGGTFDASTGSGIKCYMEKVTGYAGGDGQPGSAMFNFGDGFGFLKGVLTALQVPFFLIPPASWQRALNLGCRGTERGNYAGLSKEQASIEKHRVSQVNARLKRIWKNHLKEVAQRLYPRIRVTLDNADALLILEYARRQENAESGTNIPKVYVEPNEARYRLNPTDYVMSLPENRQLDLTATDGAKVTFPTVTPVT